MKGKRHLKINNESPNLTLKKSLKSLTCSQFKIKSGWCFSLFLDKWDIVYCLRM